jgi:hypothetical protein
MNTLLKAVLKEVSDLVAAGVDLASKAGLPKILSDLLVAGEDIPAILAVASSAELRSELQALVSNPAADADLLADVTALVSGDSAKAQKVIAASATLLLSSATNIAALVAAVQS